MNLENSKTYENLAKAFAGECQAGARYQFLAKKAEMDGYYAMSEMIKVLAKNEMAHAKVFYNFITSNGTKKVDSINIVAGYPYKSGELADELAYSAENEFEESEHIYPEFASIAEKEGFGDVAAAFQRISVIENCHKEQLEQLSTLLKDKTIYSKKQATDWKCSECGYEAKSKNAWKICPVCKYGQGYVDIPLPNQQG